MSCPCVSARKLWGEYARGSDGIIFVVDAAEEERLPEAKKSLHVRVKRAVVSAVWILFTPAQYALVVRVPANTFATEVAE